MPKITKGLLFALLIIALSLGAFLPAQAQEAPPVVHAVLFFSPTCPHCEQVINQDLPPLFEKYGNQLQILGINTTIPEGQALYQAAITAFQVPQERMGVPALVIGDDYLVGSVEIPAQLPGLIEQHLAAGGLDYPDIPGLSEIVEMAESQSGEAPAHSGDTPADEAAAPAMEAELTIPQESGPTNPMLAQFMLDPVANSIAVAMLFVMIGSIVWVVVRFVRPQPAQEFAPKWLIPVLSVFGMGVAFYLSYVETSGAEAFCGPVGDCNAVQLSPYATLFGFLPVGLLGLVGYVLLLLGWAVQHYGPENLRWVAAIAVWGMAFFGVLFSIYLTFLEPFVIGATCMWCITSAILQTIIFIVATDPAKRAWQIDDEFDEED